MGLSIELPHDMAADFLQGKPKRAPKTKILEVASYHSCHILFSRSERISSFQTQGKRITLEHKYQEAGSPGAILEAVYQNEIYQNLYQWRNFNRETREMDAFNLRLRIIQRCLLSLCTLFLVTTLW